MRTGVVVLLSLIFLLALLPTLAATEVSAGPWDLQTDLNESDARALMGQISFQLDATTDNHWIVSSTQLLFSDSEGNLQPNITLFSACISTLNCTSSADLYRSESGHITRLGHLQPKATSIFTPPQSSGVPETPSSVMNESNTPLASINPSFSIPAEWLWALALLIVLGVTLTFLLRNRD